MRVMHIVGARPNFIKIAPIMREIARYPQVFEQVLVHTSQHYDDNMSRVFFDELELPRPDVNLEVGSGSHAWQTAQVMLRLEPVLLDYRPDWVIVVGDVNSTLASALVVCKSHSSLAHVEAGLRSFNREMPEEHNRVLTDHCSDLLFCPTQTAMDNLAREGITLGVHLVGDTMYDAVLQFAEIARQRSTILEDLGLKPKGYLLATVHRPYNTDVLENLRNILAAFAEIGEPIIFPVHPRTQQRIVELDGVANSGFNRDVRMIEPVGYLDMLVLEQHARMIMTDSGGVQKEAYFFCVPCVTLRPETEWVETVETGWNVVVGADRSLILAAVNDRAWPRGIPLCIFGDGTAAEKIVSAMSQAG